MSKSNNTDPAQMLSYWRARILNGFLTIATLLATPAWVVAFILTGRSTILSSAGWVLSGAYLLLILLAVLRMINYRIRAWGLLLVIYIAALSNLSLGGIRSVAPWYLLALPIFAFVLLGIRSGLITSILTALLMVAFTYLINQQDLVLIQINPWTSLNTFLMMLAVITALLYLFHRFQEQLIEKERSTRANLLHTQSLLEEQNATLEEKITHRTEELLKNYEIQTALFKATEAASESRDMQDFLGRIHQIISELMYTENFFIALYDETSGMVSFPYFVGQLSVPTQAQSLEKFHDATGYVLRSGKSIRHGREQFNQLVADGEIDAEESAHEDSIGAPLKADGKVIGAIFAQSYEKDIRYTAWDDEALTFVAQYIATALTRLRALEAERQRNNELATLYSISEGMVQTLDMKTMTRLVGDKLREIFAADSVIIMLLDRQTDLIYVPYEYDRTEGGYIDYVEPFPLGTGLSSKVISTGLPLMLGTLEDELANGAYFPPEIIAKGQGFFSQSWLGVPIITNGQVLGLVALADARAYAFNENHMRLLQTLSANMGMAIENARLFQSEKQRAAEFAIINSVQNSIQTGLASQLDMQAIYELVGDKVREVFNANTVVLLTFDLENNLIHRHYTIERNVRYHFEPLPIPAYWHAFIRDGCSQLINHHLLEAMQAVDPDFKVPVGDVPKSAVTVPLRIHGKLIGAISLQNVDQEDAFNESDMRLLETLANSLSAALENARLLAETQRLLEESEQHNTELAIINSVQEALASKLDTQAVYELIGQKVGEVFGVDVVDIVIYDPLANLISMPYSFEKGDRSVINPRKPYGFRLHVIQTREPLLINKDFMRLAHQHNNPLLTGDWPLSALFVPLLVAGQVRGIISIQDLEREHAFKASDVRLLQTLANAMSVALENARLFDETQRLLNESEQRATELAIINNVQSALTKILDFQSIVDLVGDKLREVFNTPDLLIGWYEPQANLIHYVYLCEHGQRIKVPSIPPLRGGKFQKMQVTRQPIVFNTLAD